MQVIAVAPLPRFSVQRWFTIVEVVAACSMGVSAQLLALGCTPISAHQCNYSQTQQECIRAGG